MSYLIPKKQAKISIAESVKAAVYQIPYSPYDTKMPRIFIAFDDLGLGGVQTKMIGVANQLAKSSSNKVVFFIKNSTTFDKSAQLNKKVTLLVTPQMFPSIIKARYYYLILLILVMWQPHSILVSLEKTSLWVLKLKKWWSIWGVIKTKVIINIDIYLKTVQIAKTGEILTFFSQADHVVAVSSDTYLDLKSRVKIPSPPLELIPNWTAISAQSLPPQQLKRPVDFLFAGRLTDQKQPLELIAFMLAVKKHRETAKLHVYGNGELEETFKNRIAQYKLDTMVSCFPPTQKIDQKLKKTTYLILLSKYEGLPFIALEAMKAGCIILCLDNPGLRDIVDDDTTGFRKKTVSELVFAWASLEHNHKKIASMQKAAFKKVTSEFSLINQTKFCQLLTN